MELTEFIGLVHDWAIPIIALSIPIIVYFSNRRKKILSYEFINKSPILTIHKNVKSNIQIIVDGIPVNDPYLITLKIKNSGNEVIKENEFYVPIECIFNDNVRILSYDILDRHPKDWDYHFDIKNNRIIFKSTLLNKKEYVTINMIVSNYKNTDENPKITGRIEGGSVSEISHDTEKDRKNKGIGLIILYTGFVALLVLNDKLNNTIFYLIILIGLFIYIFPRTLEILNKRIDVSIE